MNVVPSAKSCFHRREKEYICVLRNCIHSCLFIYVDTIVDRLVVCIVVC